MKSQIFLTGPGRSGTTLTNYMLSHHPEITSINSWYAVTKKPVFNLLGERLRRVPALRNKFGKKRGFPRANEPLKLFSDSLTDFWDAVNLRQALDSTEKIQFRNQLEGIMKLEPGHKSLITKLTGPPFNHVLRDIFPESKIVWVDRDPRAVVLSYMKMGWVGVERISSQEISSLTREELIKHACDRYMHYYNLRMKESFAYILHYEDLVKDTVGQVRELLNALELSVDSGYLKFIESIPVYENRNSRYELEKEEQTLMDQLLNKPLQDRKLI